LQDYKTKLSELQNELTGIQSKSIQNENEISKMYETQNEEQMSAAKEEYETQNEELQSQLNLSVQSQLKEAEENSRLMINIRQIQTENERIGQLEQKIRSTREALLMKDEVTYFLTLIYR
jgi:hypothetical protein